MLNLPINRSINQNVARIRRVANTGNVLTHSDKIYAASAYFFTLSDLPNYKNFTNVYDAYRIDLVEVRIRNPALVNISDVLPGGDPPLCYVIDYDDSKTLDSYEGMRSYTSYRQHTFNDIIEFKFQPTVAMTVYGSAVNTAYSVKSGQWIDCLYPGTMHYGMKVLLRIDKPISWVVEPTLTVSFRHVKG